MSFGHASWQNTENDLMTSDSFECLCCVTFEIIFPNLFCNSLRVTSTVFTNCCLQITSDCGQPFSLTFWKVKTVRIVEAIPLMLVDGISCCTEPSAWASMWCKKSCSYPSLKAFSFSFLTVTTELSIAATAYVCNRDFFKHFFWPWPVV